MKDAHIVCLTRTFKVRGLNLPNDTMVKGQIVIRDEAVARGCEDLTHGHKVGALSVRYVERAPAPRPKAAVTVPAPVAPSAPTRPSVADLFRKQGAARRAAIEATRPPPPPPKKVETVKVEPAKVEQVKAPEKKKDAPKPVTKGDEE